MSNTLSDEQLESMTLEQLLDETIQPQSRLIRIENQITQLFKDRGLYIGSCLQDQIMSAVHDGLGWRELLAIYAKHQS